MTNGSESAVGRRVVRPVCLPRHVTFVTAVSDVAAVSCFVEPYDDISDDLASPTQLRAGRHHHIPLDDSPHPTDLTKRCSHSSGILLHRVGFSSSSIDY